MRDLGDPAAGPALSPVAMPPDQIAAAPLPGTGIPAPGGTW